MSTVKRVGYAISEKTVRLRFTEKELRAILAACRRYCNDLIIHDLKDQKEKVKELVITVNTGPEVDAAIQKELEIEATIRKLIAVERNILLYFKELPAGYPFQRFVFEHYRKPYENLRF
jgi:transcription termination factor NusB